MIRQKLEEYLNRLVLLGAGIAIGVIIIITYMNFSKHLAVIIGLVNIVVFAAGFVFIELVHRRNTKSQVDLLCAAISNIFIPEYPVATADNEFVRVFTEVACLREKLRNQNDERTKILNIVDSVASNVDLNSMLEDMLPKILEITKSNCGAFYIANNSIDKLEIKYSVGFNKNIYGMFDISIGEGLIGDLSDRKNIKVINDIPTDTIYVSRTFMGSVLPKSLMVIPVSNNDELAGVLVLSSIYNYNAGSIEHASLIQYYMSIAIGNSITHENNKKLNNELKFQNKLIQDFNEELEKMMAERSLLFDNIIDSIQEYAIYTMDKDGIINTWNKGAENITGLSSQEVIGKSCEYIYPEDEVKNGLVSRRFNIVNNSGKHNEIIWRSARAGKKYYADTTLYAIKNESSNIIGYANVTKDISNIKNMENAITAERQLSYMLMENDSTPLLLCGFTGHIINSNLAARSLLNMDNKALMELTFSDLMEDSEKVHLNAKASVSTGKIISMSNMKLKSGNISINVQIIPLDKALSETSVMFAFNEYIKDKLESINWMKS